MIVTKRFQVQRSEFMKAFQHHTITAHDNLAGKTTSIFHIHTIACPVKDHKKIARAAPSLYGSVIKYIGIVKTAFIVISNN